MLINPPPARCRSKRTGSEAIARLSPNWFKRNLLVIFLELLTANGSSLMANNCKTETYSHQQLAISIARHPWLRSLATWVKYQIPNFSILESPLPPNFRFSTTSNAANFFSDSILFWSLGFGNRIIKFILKFLQTFYYYCRTRINSKNWELP